MSTISTPIKDFKVGDLFIHYGATFRVTSELRISDENSNRPCYRRECECIALPVRRTTITGLLNAYNGMQGTIEVTYAKLID